MPKIIVLPHQQLCPEGQVIHCEPKTTICNALLAAGIGIEHACEKSCACTTCHVYIREGSLKNPHASDDEEDCLDKAWGLEVSSRLSCQAQIGTQDMVVEIPKYTLNMVSENH